MIWKFIAWIYQNKISTMLLHEYLTGWEDGVNQQLYEPDSASHGYLTPEMYYGVDEVE